MAKKCEVGSCRSAEFQMPVDCYLVPFPDDKDGRQPLWIEFVKGKGSTWRPGAKSRVCTLHFASHNFFNNGRRRSRLLRTAVPTLEPDLVPSSTLRPSCDAISETSSWSATAKPILPKPSVSLQSNLQTKFNGSSLSDVLNYMKVEEEEYLNKVQLKRSIRGLLIHVDDLCKRFQNDPVKEPELNSMRYILLKVLNNINLSPQEALSMFQNEVAEKNYNHLRRLVKVEKKQFKALVRSFSLSLHFFSQPAYSYIRQKLRGAVPHPRTIQAWYTTIDKYMP
ncbi:uncharacterized protein LOC117642616 [Thrips palmi]|uniref:Uncharacterized protein LOC117642616 n=1 Tax=Thrips palmi TaxID=161013 RepID=A0A6P8YB52_THRPL|nr:uncharacterized protein LOC117642616 [Thrips palmi]